MDCTLLGGRADEADFNVQVLSFIRSGDSGRFEELSDVVPSLFSGPSPWQEEGEIVEVPVFSGAIIFAPRFGIKTVSPPDSQHTEPNAAGPSKSKNKRQGACPVNLHEFLSAQADSTAGFFDIRTPVSGVTGVTSQVEPASASGSASSSASPAASPAATTSSPPPRRQPQQCWPRVRLRRSLYCVGNWELSPNGVQVGTNCGRDPNKTVTVTVAPGKRVVKTFFEGCGEGGSVRYRGVHVIIS